MANTLCGPTIPYTLHPYSGFSAALSVNLIVSWIALGMTIASVPIIIYMLYRIYKSYTAESGNTEAVKASGGDSGFWARLRVMIHSSKIKRLSEDLMSVREAAEKLASRAKEIGAIDVYQKARAIRSEVERRMQYSDVELLNKYEEMIDFIGKARSEIRSGESVLSAVEERLSRYDKLRSRAHEKAQEIIGMIDQLTSGSLLIKGE